MIGIWQGLTWTSTEGDGVDVQPRVMDALQDLVRMAEASSKAGCRLDNFLDMISTLAEPFHKHFIGFFIGVMPVHVHGMGQALYVFIQGLFHLGAEKTPGYWWKRSKHPETVNQIYTQQYIW